jgi:uncharacterized membrane protein
VLSVRINELGIEGTAEVYTQQILVVQPLEGEFKGMLFETDVSYQTPNNQNLAPFRAGDRIILNIHRGEGEGETYVSVHTLIRTPYVVAIITFFLLLIAVIGRTKGLKTILSLTLTMGTVIFILIPALAAGRDPVLSTIVSSVFIAVLSLLLIGGWNKKVLSAILGTIAGLCCAGLITMIANGVLRISTIELEDVEMLIMSNVDFMFNLSGLITSGILISCLGAVMDVSTSISSVVNEVYDTNPSLTQKELFKSGMSVGSDIMGTMANTLILAYTGGMMILMVTWSVYQVSFLDMLNAGYIVVEVIKVICGSIGMILAIPFTAWIASLLIKRPPSQGRRVMRRAAPLAVFEDEFDGE